MTDETVLSATSSLAGDDTEDAADNTSDDTLHQNHHSPVPPIINIEEDLSSVSSQLDAATPEFSSGEEDADDTQDLSRDTAESESCNSDYDTESVEGMDVETDIRKESKDVCDDAAFIKCFNNLSAEDKTMMCMRVLQCVNILENQDDRKGTFV
jgi:hypothetical protein